MNAFLPTLVPALGWALLDFSTPYLDYLCNQVEEVMRRYPEGDGIMGSPCGMLVGAVLEDGIHQLHLGRSARGTKAQRLYRQTRSWFVGDPMPCERPARSDCRCDRCWPFSFVNICDTLNIPADVLRRLVLKDDFIGPDVPLPGAGRPVGRPAGRRWRTVSIHGMGKTRVCKRP